VRLADAVSAAGTNDDRGGMKWNVGATGATGSGVEMKGGPSRSKPDTLQSQRAHYT
jgi:hypothetical protein